MVSEMCLFLLFGVIYSLADAWDYNHQDEWGNHFRQCNGNRQSPLNIKTMYPRLTHNHVKLINYNISFDGRSLPLLNTGHSVAVSFRNITEIKRPTIIRKTDYILEEIHFHWGSNRYQGSEHKFDENSHSMEAHFVHRNSRYLTFSEAVKEKDGLVVMAIIFQEIHCKKVLSLLTSKFHEVRECRNATRLHGSVNLQKIFPSISDISFYNYNGSLTTPGCNEVVEWLIYSIPVKVSSKDMKEFRALKDCKGRPMVNNFRQIQTFSGRRPVLVE